MNRVSLLDVTQITKQAIYSSPGKLSSQPGRQMCKSHFKKRKKIIRHCVVTSHSTVQASDTSPLTQILN